MEAQRLGKPRPVLVRFLYVATKHAAVKWSKALIALFAFCFVW